MKNLLGNNLYHNLADLPRLDCPAWTWGEDWVDHLISFLRQGLE